MPTPSTETAESYQPLGKPERVDREKGVVYGVRVLGPESRNGGTYPAKVQDKCKAHYDGINVYVDTGHHQTERGTNLPVTAKFARTSNARVVNDGIHVDLHYNPKHAFAEPFLWAVENDPAQYGFSHFADVKWLNQVNGTRVAESINRVVRIDLVGDPATTTSVFESTKGKTMDTSTDPRAIASTITSPDALKTFLAGLFDGLPSGTFNDAAKSAALTDLFTKYGSTADPTADPAAAAESLKAFGTVGKWAGTYIAESLATAAKADRVKKAGDLCDAEKLPAHLKTATFVELVAESMADPAKAKALIADRLAIGKPATGTPTAESKGTETQTTTRTAGDGATDTPVSDIVKGYSAGRFKANRN
ncbi:hypothetical protein BH11PLA2_BH11PLA2_32770 [soil metagenome]